MRTRRIASTMVAGMAMTLLMATLASAQERQPVRMITYELTLTDGSRLYGTIEQQDETVIVFRSVAGVVITTPRADVRSLREVAGTIAEGEFRPGDPNTTRLFFGPTGRSLPKGRVYFGMYEGLMPFVQVGVTDRFSIGGGTPLVFGFDEGDRPFWVTPKLQLLDNGRTQVAVGALQGFVDGESGGIAYGRRHHRPHRRLRHRRRRHRLLERRRGRRGRDDRRRAPGQPPRDFRHGELRLAREPESYPAVCGSSANGCPPMWGWLRRSVPASSMRSRS